MLRMSSCYKNSLEKLTILVNSCDAYEDLWMPFFTMFEKNGSDLTKLKIILNTETKAFKFSKLNVLCLQLYSKEESVEWGKRLRKTLESIKTDYVFCLLDDFFLRRKMDKKDIQIIERCIEILDSDTNVGAINLIPMDGVEKESEKYEGFCLAPKGTEYRCNAQACIWRKNVLYNSVLDDESPWIWEIYGNYRNNIIMDSDIYFLKNGVREPYDYGYINYNETEEDGSYVLASPVMRGKWYLPLVKKLFEENDINMDYNHRGVYRNSIKTVIKRNKILDRLIVLPYRMLRNILSPLKNTKGSDDIEKRMIQKYVEPYKNRQHF